MDEAGQVAEHVAGNVTQAILADVERFEAIELEEGGIGDGLFSGMEGRL